MADEDVVKQGDRTPVVGPKEGATKRTIGDGSLSEDVDDAEGGSSEPIHPADIPRESHRNTGAGSTYNEFYVLFRSLYRTKSGEYRVDMVALTPFDEGRKPYAFTMPVDDAKKVFRYVERENKEWEGDSRMPEGHKRIRVKKSNAQRLNFPDWGEGVLLVTRNNIAFSSLENYVHRPDGSSPEPGEDSGSVLDIDAELDERGIHDSERDDSEDTDAEEYVVE